MKQLSYLCFLLSLIPTHLSGQNILDLEIDSLVDKEIIVLDREERLRHIGFSGFYIDKSCTEIYAPTSAGFSSNYDSLAGQIFVITMAEELKTNSVSVYHLLTLQGSKSGTIFYKYNASHNQRKPFEFTGIAVDWCDKLYTYTDKFTGDTKVSSPIQNPISLSTTKTSTGTTPIYLYMEASGSIVAVSKKGASILLDNEEVITWEYADIDVDVRNGRQGYVYSTYLLLNQSQIQKIIDHPIRNIRLYIFDQEIEDGEQYSEYLKCMLDKN